MGDLFPVAVIAWSSSLFISMIFHYYCPETMLCDLIHSSTVISTLSFRDQILGVADNADGATGTVPCSGSFELTFNPLELTNGSISSCSLWASPRPPPVEGRAGGAASRSHMGIASSRGRQITPWKTTTWQNSSGQRAMSSGYLPSSMAIWEIPCPPTCRSTCSLTFWKRYLFFLKNI